MTEQDFKGNLSNGEEKKAWLGNFNNLESIKKNNLKGIDEDEEKAIGKSTYGWLVFLSIIGIIFLIILATGIGIWSYTLHKDGTLIPKFVCSPNIQVNNTCPNIPACPVTNCPACPNLICGNITISKINCLGNSS